MVFDIILIVIMVASFGYTLYLIVGKFPQLSNINVRSLPEQRQIAIKRRILEDKLKKDFRTGWEAMKKLVGGQVRSRISSAFSRVYEKLKDLEHEYRITRQKDLSSEVSKTRLIEEGMVAARDHLAKKEYEQAEQHLLGCIKIDEHNVRVYTLLAQLYREQGDYDHAKETLEFIVQLTSSKDPYVYSDLGSIALARGDYATAQEDYLRSISLDPENYRYHLELAEVFNATGEHEKARDAAQKALTLAPNNPKILDFLIENSIMLHDKSRASEYLTKLIEVNPQNGKISSFQERITALPS